MCNRSSRQEMYDPRKDSGLLYNLPCVSGQTHGGPMQNNCQSQGKMKGNFGSGRMPLGEMFTVRSSQWREQTRRGNE
jgi:hypothetical protein